MPNAASAERTILRFTCFRRLEPLEDAVRSKCAYALFVDRLSLRRKVTPFAQ
jgi:hypothetical protein